MCVVPSNRKKFCYADANKNRSLGEECCLTRLSGIGLTLGSGFEGHAPMSVRWWRPSSHLWLLYSSGAIIRFKQYPSRLSYHRLGSVDLLQLRVNVAQFDHKFQQIDHLYREEDNVNFVFTGHGSLPKAILYQSYTTLHFVSFNSGRFRISGFGTGLEAETVSLVDRLDQWQHLVGHPLGS